MDNIKLHIHTKGFSGPMILRAFWHLEQGSEITVTHYNEERGDITIHRPEEERLMDKAIVDNNGEKYRIIYTVADMPDGYFYGRGHAQYACNLK